MTNDQRYSGEEPADDVMQDATPDAPVVVPVRLDEPANVRELPALSGGMTRVTLDVNGARILVADPKRKIVTLLSFDQTIYLGSDQANVAANAGTPNGARWPANTPLVITHCDEVWASSAASTTEVSIITERWAR
jgi:hypothetical protein